MYRKVQQDTRQLLKPLIQSISKVKSNFLKTSTVAVILSEQCLFGIEDTIPCSNLTVIKLKRKIKLAETMGNSRKNGCQQFALSVLRCLKYCIMFVLEN